MRRTLFIEPLEDRLAPANLTITNLRTVDASNNLQPSPVFGQMIYLRANWNSTAMVGGETCTVRYTVNGFPADSGSVSHSAGSGSWNWYRGGWYIGTAAITVTATVDPDNLIAETNESDNTATLTITPIVPTDLPSKFLQPIGRTANVDWAINNYADVDPRGTAVDALGGGYEYDGHDAIDAGPWGNDGMDAGFPIYAAAGGTISAVADGNFDRQTAATGAPGNYVQITHGNGWQTLYYHFAKDTITVKVGDTVKAGQVIGLMGSSGNSTGTHLHYTAFYRGCQVEAAFSPSTYWINPLPYAGNVPAFAMDAWVSNQNPSSDVSERFSRVNQFLTTQSGTLYFPAIIYNLRTPGVTSTATWKWYRPNGTTWNTGTVTPSSNTRFGWWYYFYPISNFTGTPGTWNYALEINGVEVKRVPFTISATAGEAALRVSDSATAVVSDERTTPYTFTSTAQGGTAPTQVYTLQNLGGATLNLTGWSAPFGFSFVGSPPATLAAGASTTVTLQMNTTAVGYSFGRVLFNTNDPQHPEFTFNVEGTVTGTVPVGSPVVALPDAALGFNFKSLPRAIAPNATLTDPNSTTFNALSVYVASGADGFDKLELRNQGTGAGQIGVTGLTVTYGGTTIGTLQVVPAPNSFGVNFNASATPAIVQAIMRNVLYSHTGTVPFYNRRAIAFAVQDSSGLASNWAFETITPSGVERAPTIATLTNAATLTGLALTKNGSFADTFGNTWSATADYGDGAGPQPLTLNADKTFTLSRTYATAGAFPVTVTINSDTGGTKTATFTVNVYAPPSVNSLAVNDGNTQRSRITKVVLNLGASVDASIFQTPGIVSLTRAGGPAVDLTNGLQIAPATGLTNTLTLTFANVSNAGLDSGSLADGRWQVSIPAMGYSSPLNGTALRRLFGDFDGNGTVDATDFSFFPSFGAATNSPFDFNNNGDIDSATDLAQFGNRFGVTL